MPASTDLMKAVVFLGPGKVSLQERPIPKLQHDGDIIVKVHAAGLCGSELHVLRGHEKTDPGFIMGHEFTGTVVEKGSAVRSLQVGDKVVSPFTVSCMECFYCQRGHSSRCIHSSLFGSPALDGAQADFVRVPWADGTVVKAPKTLSDNALLLMADIWPTGFFGATTAFGMLREQERADVTAVVVGCGPVGLCAIIAALDFRPRRLLAIDSVPSRLQLAKELGAEPINFLTEDGSVKQKIDEATAGRGADIVIEVVGSGPALRTAFDAVRPFGIVYSIGVHNGEMPFSAAEGYGKNLRLQMGRCPVRSIFPQALEMLERKQDLVGFMFDKMMPLAEAVDGYELFDQMKVQKVIFTP